MKLLLKAALRTKKHVLLLTLNVLTLLALTFASQMEMFAFGVITNTGVDFFELFGEGKASYEISQEDVIEKWTQVESGEENLITRKSASSYLAQKDGQNFLGKLIFSVRSRFHVEESFELIIGTLIFVAMFKAIFLFYSRYVTQVLSIKISRDLRKDYFAHIQKLPMSFYQKYNLGSLSTRVGADASQIALSLNSCVTNYLHTPFNIVSTLLICFYISWKLSLVIFVGLPLIVIPVILVTRKVKQITRRWQKHQETFTSTLIDFLNGIKTVKIFSMEDFAQKKYEEHNNKMAYLETKTAKYDLLTRPILHTVTMLCLVAVIFFGLYVLKMSISELLVYCGMLHLFYEPVKKFAEENANIQKGVVAAERLFEVLLLKPQNEDEKGAIELDDFKESIEFDKVWFAYEERWVLKDLSFEVKKGETLAIVGATGAGKSTLVELLPRLHDVQKGEIRIDGIPIKRYTKKSLRGQISFVSQKPFLFFDTIAANISYGSSMPEKEIFAAAKSAYADEFIRELPQKYLTHLAEMGQNLSGGQQQRLSIARALAKQAPILILDEATSALDALSENRIKQAIIDLHGSLTQIIIAHRLTTIEHADRIIFLEQGQKIAEGTKDELLESCPTFRLMWETHFLTKDSLV
ncbi:MAG: ABC transporter ATP-binding protein [Simkaniaceae bacterium]